MAYSIDMRGAARRHLDAADKLALAQREDVAGYLYGIAAECAVKAMAQTLPCARDKEILMAHFPDLRTLLREALTGRTAVPLLRILENDAYLNEWEIRVRYAPSREVRNKPLNGWAEQARRTVNMMGEFA
ncbi:hypothetical protein [Anaeromyxobacter paludicola]|uniref:hypothetical protein n=1 Tax=Anaeromyxobacter paludicola TaxID=2918171 RepID=UPI0020BDC2AA|nr:hypothetical protein [Anaeromyxobacter paludicola]